MQRVLKWRPRWWVIAAVVGGLAVVAASGYYGYITSQAGAQLPIEEPPTVEVSKGEVQLSVTAPGQLADAGEQSLQSEVNGKVTEVLVQPGDVVTQGQVLARLGDRATFEAAVADAELALAEAQAELDAAAPEALLAQARLDYVSAEQALTDAQNKRASQDYARTTDDWIDIARANYVLAEDELERAEEYYSGFSGQPDNDPVRAQALSQLANARRARDTALANLNWLLSKPSEQEIAQADAELESARVAMEQAKAKYERMQAGQYTERELAEARLKKAQALLDEARRDLDQLEVKSPLDGVVVEVPVKAGQAVNEGMELLTVIDPHDLEAVVTVVEEDLPLVRAGQAAQLFFDALPDAEVTGRIDRIVPRRASGDRAVYTVYITLDTVPPELVSGMTVDTSIVIENRVDVLRLPRAVVRARSDGTADVEVWTGFGVQKRSATTGLRGDSFIEILDGLQEGDQVVAQ